jgi:hypothetical protein
MAISLYDSFLSFNYRVGSKELTTSVRQSQLHRGTEFNAMANQGYEWSGTADEGVLPKIGVMCMAQSIIQGDDACKQHFSKELEICDDKVSTGDKTPVTDSFTHMEIHDEFYQH